MGKAAKGMAESGSSASARTRGAADLSTRSGRRPGLRAAALGAAITLSLPLFGLTQAGQQAAAEPVQTPGACSAPAALPITQSGREAAAAAAAARWFPADQVAVATAVAGAESSWNPTAVNKAARGNYGLWQINSVHKKLLKSATWSNPNDNAWMAFQVWDAADGVDGNGQGSWRPWSAYNSGSYRAYLRDLAPAVSSDPNADFGGDGGGDCGAMNPTTEVKVGTWNVLKSNAKSGIRSGIRAMTESADVFGLQELGARSDRAAVAAAAAKAGYTGTTDHTAVPIYYRTAKYNVISQGRERAFGAGEKIESRADGSRAKGKWVTWIQLQDKSTQETFYVVNTHFLVGAYNNSTQARKNDRRVALYQRQLATVTGLANSYSSNSSAVYVTCDCNVNYNPKSEPVELMADSGLTPNWQHLDGKPTIGKKTRLDYVWSNRAPTKQVVGDKHGSDHSPVVVTYPPTTGAPGAVVPVVGSDSQEIYSMRTITDPSSGRTFVVPIPAGKVGKVLQRALNQVGDQWQAGGAGPNNWDAAGLTAGAWDAAKVTLPAQAQQQRATVRQVNLANAQPGDIFSRGGSASIYLGTVSGQRYVVVASKAKGAVVVQQVRQSDIATVLRPAG